MKKVKLTPSEKRRLRKAAFGAIGGTSAVLAGAGVASGHPESLIFVPISIQAYRLARKRGLTKKQKQKHQKALKHLFFGAKKKKTRKLM